MQIKSKLGDIRRKFTEFGFGSEERGRPVVIYSVGTFYFMCKLHRSPGTTKPLPPGLINVMDWFPTGVWAVGGEVAGRFVGFSFCWHLTAIRAWFRQCLHGRLKPDLSVLAL